MEAKNVVSIEKYYPKSKDKPKRLKRKGWNFFFSLFIILVIGGIFYFSSSLSKLSIVYFEGLHYVSRADLLRLADVTYDDYFIKLDGAKIASNLLKHPLVEEVVVKKKGMNQLMIEVQEKDVLGCVELDEKFQYVLNDGSLIDNDQILHGVCQGTVIYGLTEKDLKENILSLFAQSLSEVDPIFVQLIKEIHYEPMYGDVNRFSLFLQDGNTVKVNSYSLPTKLKYYQTMVEEVFVAYEGVKGTYHLDVGDYFEPYTDATKNTESVSSKTEKVEE